MQLIVIFFRYARTGRDVDEFAARERRLMTAIRCGEPPRGEVRSGGSPRGSARAFAAAPNGSA